MKKQDDLAVCRSVRYTRGPRKGAVKCSQCGFFFVPDERQYPLGNPEPYLTGVEWFSKFKCCPNCLPADYNSPFGKLRCIGVLTPRGRWSSARGCNIFFAVKYQYAISLDHRRIQTCAYCKNERSKNNIKLAIENATKLVRELGHAPTQREWDNSKLRPSRGTIQNHFGSWNNFARTLGIEPNSNVHPEIVIDNLPPAKYSIRYMKRVLRRASESNNGYALSIAQWDSLKLRPCSSTIQYHFGTWRKAWESIGVPLPTYPSDGSEEGRKLFEEIRRKSRYHPDNLPPRGRKSWQDTRLLDRITQLAQESADAEQRWQEHKFKRKS